MTRATGKDRPDSTRAIALDELRRFAVARSLFPPVTLQRALEKLGFVQADPIRAPARAQDLILRHRVADYRLDDLERRYPTLDIEEDYFINYGFVTRGLQALMHPRTGVPAWSRRQRKDVLALLEFTRERGEVHPRDVDRHFSRGRVTNYWGGSSSATTHLLDLMHYRGLLRVARRELGIRVYAAHDRAPELTGVDTARSGSAALSGLPSAGAGRPERPALQSTQVSCGVDASTRQARVDRLVDIVVGKYAPMPAASLSTLISRLRYGAPQWKGQLRQALERAKGRLSQSRIDGIDWYWPADEDPRSGTSQEEVRFLAPFDPLVWDRRRFQLLWSWPYRFEAYTPAAKRKLGYYALPLLWRDRVIGWANLTVRNSAFEADIGYVNAKPNARSFRRELEAELERMRTFLGFSQST